MVQCLIYRTPKSVSLLHHNIMFGFTESSQVCASVTALYRSIYSPAPVPAETAGSFLFPAGPNPGTELLPFGTLGGLARICENYNRPFGQAQQSKR